MDKRIITTAAQIANVLDRAVYFDSRENKVIAQNAHVRYEGRLEDIEIPGTFAIRDYKTLRDSIKSVDEFRPKLTESVFYLSEYVGVSANPQAELPDWDPIVPPQIGSANFERKRFREVIASLAKVAPKNTCSDIVGSLLISTNELNGSLRFGTTDSYRFHTYTEGLGQGDFKFSLPPAALQALAKMRPEKDVDVYIGRDYVGFASYPEVLRVRAKPITWDDKKLWPQEHNWYIRTDTKKLLAIVEQARKIAGKCHILKEWRPIKLESTEGLVRVDYPIGDTDERADLQLEAETEGKGFAYFNPVYLAEAIKFCNDDIDGEVTIVGVDESKAVTFMGQRSKVLLMPIRM